MRPGRLLLSASMLFASVVSAPAMEFSILNLENSPPILFAYGDIVTGDAQRLAAYLDLIPRDVDGLKNLALHSDGGMVEVAFEMTAVMDRVGVNTIVPPGARCASACASIVYIAGTYKVVIEGGALGMHHCYSVGLSGEIALRPECNDEVATHALAHGVAYGSVAAFMGYAPPNEMIWIDATHAECLGLTRYPGEPVAAQKDAPCVVAAIREQTR